MAAPALCAPAPPARPLRRAVRPSWVLLRRRRRRCCGRAGSMQGFRRVERADNDGMTQAGGVCLVPLVSGRNGPAVCSDVCTSVCDGGCKRLHNEQCRYRAVGEKQTSMQSCRACRCRAYDPQEPKSTQNTVKARASQELHATMWARGTHPLPIVLQLSSQACLVTPRHAS